VPLLQAAMHHPGFALIDVLSPCVTFNDHEGSTRSYEYSREHYEEAVHTDFVAPASAITVQYAEGEALPVTMHDGSRIILRKVDKDYDPLLRGPALQRIRERLRNNEYLTGLLHISTGQPEFHEQNATPDAALNQVPYAVLNPGAAALSKLLSRYR
jgi:2-oxoglutarate ferredoxin oxidoreductase subunit beta